MFHVLSKNQDKTFESHTLILNKRLCMTDFLFKYTIDLGGSMASVSIEPITLYLAQTDPIQIPICHYL